MAIILSVHGDRHRNARVAIEDARLVGDNKDALDFLYGKIGCSWVDVVRLPNGVDMWVDDEGMFKENAWLNPVATGLRTTLAMKEAPIAVIPCFGWEIYGNAVLTGHDDFGNTVDLTDEQVEWIEGLIGKVVRHAA